MVKGVTCFTNVIKGWGMLECVCVCVHRVSYRILSVFWGGGGGGHSKVRC